MRKTTKLTAALVGATGMLILAVPVAQAVNFGDMFNPGRWFGNNDDDWYDRYGRGPYGGYGPYGGWGGPYGYAPYGGGWGAPYGYGYGAPYGYGYGAPYVQQAPAQSTTSTPAPPPVPE
jgi:hypothetical protein